MHGKAGAFYEFGRHASEDDLWWNKPAEKDKISDEIVVRRILCHYSLDLSRLH